MALVDGVGKSLEKLPILLTTVDTVLDFGLARAQYLMPMGTACCAIEFMGSVFPRFDFDRHGAMMRSDPRHADVMMMMGTITRKMQPAIKRIYEQMPDPKWVIAFGNCAVSGGIFTYDSYSVVRGVDEFLPVDIYVAGCPPRPEALIDAFLQLRELQKQRSIVEGKTYERELPLPVPGQPSKPDEGPGAGDDE